MKQLFKPLLLSLMMIIMVATSAQTAYADDVGADQTIVLALDQEFETVMSNAIADEQIFVSAETTPQSSHLIVIENKLKKTSAEYAYLNFTKYRFTLNEAITFKSKTLSAKNSFSIMKIDSREGVGKRIFYNLSKH